MPPIKECQVKGKKGWKWGHSTGTCYTGKGGRGMAGKQAAAAHAAGYGSKKKK